jgi:hypothetical protein
MVTNCHAQFHYFKFDRLIIWEKKECAYRESLHVSLLLKMMQGDCKIKQQFQYTKPKTQMHIKQIPYFINHPYNVQPSVG